MKALGALGLPMLVFVLGLPMQTLGSDLSCSPGLILCLVSDLGLGLWIEFSLCWTWAWA